MIKITTTLAIALTFVGCTSSDIKIDNFELGDYSKWTTEGEAFGFSPAKGSLDGQQNVHDFEGEFLANSFYGGDNTIGVIRSSKFTIQRDYINFRLGGGGNKQLYIELLINQQSVYKTSPLFDAERLVQLSWDVAKYKGQEAQIRIVDNHIGGWGHILVDDIDMSNTRKSIVEVDYKLSYDATMKYLLVPIEDNGPESSVQLLVEGNKVGMPMDIRVAQAKIDYWIPIHIEQYSGKEVTLVFNHIKNTDIGYTQIKQSNSFDFNYNEKYRPAYHFSPQYGWMNDPNGMVYKDGKYHLFYQYNAYGSRWANMHWGHAISEDLVKWEYLPLALAPDSIGAIFSGSAVVDENNTAGFGKDAIVAIYTSAGASQTQSLAYSTDNGNTFVKYENNPVLADANIADFRDPKVFWHEGSKRWVMSLATSQTITFYGSSDLKSWEKLSEFGEVIGAHGGVWECPDLFQLDYKGKKKWILLVSINPGGPNGGSATQYFIGEFNGTSFVPDRSIPYPIWIDWGRDNYAGVTWSDVPKKDGRRIFMGWMSNWDYANDVPTLNFRSAMTTARELKIMHNGKHLVLGNYPVKEFERLQQATEALESFEVNKEYTVDRLLKNNSGAFELNLVVEPKAAKHFCLTLKNKQGEHIDFAFKLTEGMLCVDRTASGNTDFNGSFAGETINAPLTKKTSYSIRLIIDKASAELFVNEGELAQTNLIFPTEPYDVLNISTDASVRVSHVQVHRLSK